MSLLDDGGLLEGRAEVSLAQASRLAGADVGLVCTAALEMLALPGLFAAFVAWSVSSGGPAAASVPMSSIATLLDERFNGVSAQCSRSNQSQIASCKARQCSTAGPTGRLAEYCKVYVTVCS